MGRGTSITTSLETQRRVGRAARAAGGYFALAERASKYRDERKEMAHPMVVKRTLLTTTTVDAAARELTLWERIVHYKWWVTTKVIFYGLVMLVPLYFFLNAPDGPGPKADGPMGWLINALTSMSDLTFSMMVVAFYLGMLAFEITSLPQPMPLTKVTERNREALAKLDEPQC